MTKGKFKIDKSDMTADCSHGVLFITHKFKNGFYLGFYSHSPWGRVRNQVRGWAVISSTEIVDEICTYDWGSTGSDYRQWISDQIEAYGKRTKVLNDFDEPHWKMSEAL